MADDLMRMSPDEFEASISTGLKTVSMLESTADRLDV
jgi:hypothetical protein